MKFNTLLLGSTLFISLGAPNIGAAGVAVIAHPDTHIQQADSDSIKRLYLGKTSKVLGIKMNPVDQTEGSSTRDEFYNKVVDKDPSQLKAYWAQLIFTGGGSPPSSVANDNAVKELVSSKSNAIGYIDSDQVDNMVKVIFTAK